MQLDERPSTVTEDPPVRKPWLRNAWYAAAWSAELRSGNLFARTILNEPLLLARQPNGKVVALADYCPHRYAPLSAGKMLADGNIQCGYHGLQFDGRGRCAVNPHDGNIPPNANVPTYPILEKYGVAWIWMGPAAPDEATLADYRMFENVPPLFSSLQEYLHAKAPYGLLQDNLLDSSHVFYVHVGTLRKNEGETNQPKTTVEQRGNEVSIDRSSTGVLIPATQQMQYGGDGRNADNWSTIRWNPPGSILIHSAATDRGTERSAGTGHFAMHLLTPETETTTHYHFWAVRWNPRDRDEATSRRILDVFNTMRRRAFEEQDLPLIMAQQQNLLRLGSAAHPALFSIDVAAVRARNVLDRLLASEARAGV